MSLYEITFLTKEETDPGVRPLLEEMGAAINGESTLGRRRLAYPIKKETQAVYTTYVFDIEPSQLADFNRRLGLNTNILRYLIVTKETARADKEVSKTVREAIEAAEKLEDTVSELPATPPASKQVAEAVETIVTEAPMATEAAAEPEIVTPPAADAADQDKGVTEPAPLAAEQPVNDQSASEPETEEVPAETKDQNDQAAPVEAEAPAKPRRAKKAEAPVEQDAATATEEDRLKALEDKLGEILKD